VALDIVVVDSSTEPAVALGVVVVELAAKAAVALDIVLDPRPDGVALGVFGAVSHDVSLYFVVVKSLAAELPRARKPFHRRPPPVVVHESVPPVAAV
jgi:hypothetical protein